MKTLIKLTIWKMAERVGMKVDAFYIILDIDDSFKRKI